MNVQMAVLKELEDQRTIFATRCAHLAAKIAELEEKIAELTAPKEDKENVKALRSKDKQEPSNG